MPFFLQANPTMIHPPSFTFSLSVQINIRKWVKGLLAFLSFSLFRGFESSLTPNVPKEQNTEEPFAFFLSGITSEKEGEISQLCICRHYYAVHRRGKSVEKKYGRNLAVVGFTHKKNV